ncbi:MAG: ABC transporter ATP-binding protein [Rhodospirillales bacterium]|jgi:putative spermidine/putrescine transport system ATP-binding protein
MTADRPLSIALEYCAKTFADGTTALEPLDLSVSAGETVVLLGPSGCGKTTTLRMIAGLERPDAGGRVLFDGCDVTRQPIEARNVGMVFQSYALFPNMTVAENIGYGLRIRKWRAGDARTRVREMLTLMRIEALANRRIDQLSGGQRQRVALARALAVRPRALLLDEPLTALDAKLRDALRLEIDSLLRGLGVTTLYVTHDQAEAMALGDRIVVMDHGRVAQIGRPRDIYRHPASRFVAEFIGTMNRLTGSSDGARFTCRAGSLPLAGKQSGPCELFLRPENISLTENGEAGALEGSVTAAFFLGDRTRLFVEVGETQPLVVECWARREFAHGETVRLHVDPCGLLTL